MNNKRLIGFGRYAGIIGSYNAFLTYGLKSDKYLLKSANKCEERSEVVKELEKIGSKTPVLIGGATTSRTHTAVKIAPEYSGSVIHVNDASKAVPVATKLLSGDRDKFVEEMVETISTHGASPDWSGWYHLKKVDNKIVSIRLRSIDVVEEL